MFTLIKEGNVYAPESRGTRDILVVGRIIALISEQIELTGDFEVQVISARDKLVLPGFVDLHVHLVGGGGEGGFWTRTPDIALSTIARAGVTTLVGCLGTDDVSRHPESLLAKANGRHKSDSGNNDPFLHKKNIHNRARTERHHDMVCAVSPKPGRFLVTDERYFWWLLI